MALTKVTGHVVSPTSDYTINNVTGVAATFNNITGVAATFTGNVTIGGTLTYEDVTNIDSIGIVTARGGLHVGVGGTIIHALSEDGGKVGIGTDNPTAQLEVKGSGSSNTLNFLTKDVNRNTVFYAKDGGQVGLHYYPLVINQDTTDTATPSGTYFYVHHSSSPFIIKNDGKVGIGSEIPSQLLDVGGNTTVASNGRVNIYRPTSGSTNTAFQINSDVGGTDTTQFIIQAGGAVGIGTDNPDGKLDVRGTIFVNGDATGGRIFASGGNLSLTDGNGRQTLRIDDPGSGNTHTHVFDSSGNFGVNCTPTAKLDVRRGDDEGKIAEFHNNTGYGIDVGSGTTDAYISSGYNQSFIFKTDPGSGQIGRLRITSDGIIETGTAIGDSAYDGNQRLRVGRTGDCSISIRANGSTTSATGLDFGDDDDDRSGRIQYVHDGDYMSFHTNGAGNGTANERLRINSSGRVGINTTTDSMDGVTGNLNIANTNFNNHTVINLSRNTAADRAFIRFSNPNGNIGSINTSGSDFIISSSNDLILNANSTERLRIDSNGSLTSTADNNGQIIHKFYNKNGTASSGHTVEHHFNFNRTSGQMNLSGARIVAGKEREWVGAASNQDGFLAFYTCLNETPGEKVRITSLGRFGIGTGASVDSKLHVKSSGNADSDGIKFQTGSSGTGAKLLLMTTDNADNSKYIQHSAYWTEIGCHNNEGVRFRESDGDIRFYMNGSSGNYNFTGSNVSDRNLKENIETITTDSIDLIKQVIPRTFNWKFDRKNTPHGGFIAQEMKPLFPKLINGVEYDESRTDDGDPNNENAGKCNPTGMGFDYNGYTAYLTKAMQELIAKVEILEAKVAVLEGS